MVSSKPASLSAALILCGTLLMGGCAQPSVVKTALNGDLKQLQQEIRESQQRGDLDRDTVQDLARAVARREVHSAKGEMAVVRVQQVRACTPHVADVLRDRAQRNDDAGGVARVALLEAGIDRDERLVAEYREASSGAWRAVAARSAIGGSHGAVRRSLFLDGDERVRQAALRAALEEPDPRDLDQLLEAARLDPDPLCRSIAARAVGNVGGERAVLGLRDLWAAADEETRLVLIEAWAMPAAFKAGGERELLKVSETSTGLPSVAAAGALLRGKGAQADLALGVLLRVAEEGAYEERRLVFQLAPPSDPDILKALEKAAEGSHPQLRAIALARLLRTKQKAKALKQLEKLAKADDGGGRAARAALAAARDPKVLPLLLKDQKADTPGARQAAAIGLTYFGKWDQAASGLGDNNPWVRISVACGILSSTTARAGGGASKGSFSFSTGADG